MKNLLFFVFIAFFAGLSGCSSNPEHDHDHDDDHISSDDLSDSLHTDHLMIEDSTGIRISLLRKQPFAFTLRTGGRIIADNKDVVIITSKSSGLARFSDNYLFPGVRVTRGQTLFTVSGEKLADDNTELRLRQIKADLDKATVNFERAKKLINENIVTEEHYLSIKNEYEKILNEFENLSATSGTGGNIVTAPDNGYIRDIYVTEGRKVTSGEALASIIIERNLILRADVSPDNLAIMPEIESANFKVGYSDKIYKTSDLNGRKISYGKSTGENSFYIPVFFRIDHDPGLIEGTFTEVYLIGKEIHDALVVPNTALMEEFGKLYVYVADEHEHFIKRYITTGYSDGENTLILSGLSENERIVSSGAYLIKLSQMSASAPAHSHDH
jgi:RND family efflux transporter MFP subunit